MAMALSIFFLGGKDGYESIEISHLSTKYINYVFTNSSNLTLVPVLLIHVTLAVG